VRASASSASVRTRALSLVHGWFRLEAALWIESADCAKVRASAARPVCSSRRDGGQARISRALPVEGHLCSPDRVTRGSGGNGASTSGTAKNPSRGSCPKARHLRRLTLADPGIKPLAAGAAASGDLVAAAYPAYVG